MNIDLGRKSVGELENLRKNPVDSGKTDTVGYIAILRELEIRRSKGLDLQKTLTLVSEAASERRFVEYTEIADVNGIAWSRAHWQINTHLGQSCEYSYRQRFPLLTAIVVNSARVSTGEMTDEALAGFIRAARRLAMEIGDERAFLKSEQERVFSHFSRREVA